MNEYNMTHDHHPSFCTNCILPDGFIGLKLNENGLCNFCQDPSYKNENWAKIEISEEQRHHGKKKWEKITSKIQKSHGHIPYDCLIGYSGGKDSTALVDTFVEKYDLTPFLVTIDTGFMTKVAKQNIKDTLTKMNLYENHILIEEAIPTFTKLYRYFFMNHTSRTKTLTVEICHQCTDLIHTILIKEAMKRGIPYVIIGFSPDQIARYFFETSREDIIKDGIPNPHLAEILDEDDKKWYLYLDEITTENTHLPEIYYPYHVIDYNESEIIERIESKGLIQTGKSDPVLTNCHVVKAALMYDLYRYGGVTYALQYAELVRQEIEEKAHRRTRKSWMRLYKQIAKSILEGLFDSDGIAYFFHNIGVSQEQLLYVIQNQREADPAAEAIHKNIEALKRG